MNPATCLLLASMFGATPNVPQAAVSDSIVVIDASAAATGRYIFVVDVKDGLATLRQIRTVVSIADTGTPTPPTPDPPSTDFEKTVKSWMALVEDAEKARTAAGLAKAYEGLAKLISDGSVSSAESVKKSLTVLQSGYLAAVSKLDVWSPFTSRLDAYLKDMAVKEISDTLSKVAAILKEEK